MSTSQTPSRSIRRGVRIPDDLWAAAQARATAEGEYVSTVVRRLLVRYAAKPPAKAAVSAAGSGTAPARVFYVPDNIWDAAYTLAEERGEALSSVIVTALTRYAEKGTV